MGQKLKEKDVVWSVLEYLRVKRIFCWRNNTGGFTRGSHFYKFGDVGSPDVFAVKDGRIYGIECKVEGNEATEAQREWGKGFEEAGGVYAVAYGIKDVERMFGQ
jgi:hypothetical protein